MDKWIVWDKKFEVGYKRIDDQHRELINIINDLHACVRIGRLI